MTVDLNSTLVPIVYADGSDDIYIYIYMSLHTTYLLQ